MKEYNVYGIGNALVDMEFEVSNDFLQKHNIEKGVMTLVDSMRQAQVLGDLIDQDSHMACGGSAANSIIAVAQLEGKSFYSCKVAKDVVGDFFLDDLAKTGVKSNLEGQKRDPSLETGKCLVLITPDGERTMLTYLGITETFGESELVPAEIQKAEWLYIEGYLVTSETGRAAAIKAHKLAKEAGVKVAMTFSDPSMPAHFRPGLLEMIGGGVDLLFCNEEEAMGFTRAGNHNEAVTELKTHAKSIVITQGPRGAWIWDGENEYDITIQKPVKALDTNGAGDLFAGSFLYGITNGMSWEQSGKLACACASQLVTQFGPRLKPEQARAVLESL